MEFIHEPVLLQEVLEWMDVKPDGVYCDGTLGGGGHSGAMLRLSGGTATPNFSRFAKSGKVGAITTVIAFFIGDALRHRPRYDRD